MSRMEESLAAALSWEPLVSFGAMVLGWAAWAWQWFSGKAQIRKQMDKFEEVKNLAEKHHQELMDLRTLTGGLEFKRLNDNTSYAELPPGARLVRQNGKDRLVLPVDIRVSVEMEMPKEFYEQMKKKE